MTTFDLISDTHFDSWRQGIDLFDPGTMQNVGSDTLVVAGDTSNYIPQAVEFWKRCQTYKTVIVLDGNHEHYNADAELGMRGYPTHVPAAMDVIEKLAEQINVHFLNGTNEVIVGDTAFVGVNGWYDWNYRTNTYDPDQQKGAWVNFMNDSRYIHFPMGGAQGLANLQAQTLSNKVRHMQNRDKIKNIVVVTHSAPREDLLPETNDNTFNLLNGSFCNTRLEDVLEVDYNSKIRVWCYGHTHFRKDAVIDGVRYVNNCLGYPHEQQGEMWQFKQIHI